MDSLCTCFVAHLSPTLCYGLCNQCMNYLFSFICLFFKEETYTTKVTIYFLTEWMPCLSAMEFSEGKPIRTSQWRIKHQMLFLSLTHSLVLHRPIFESKYMIWQRFNLGYCLYAFCIAWCYPRMRAYPLLDTRAGQLLTCVLGTLVIHERFIFVVLCLVDHDNSYFVLQFMVREVGLSQCLTQKSWKYGNHPIGLISLLSNCSARFALL